MNKKVLIKAASVLALVTLGLSQNVMASVAANFIEVDGLEYRVYSDNTVTLSGCTTKCGANDLVIPASVQSMPVTKIAGNALDKSNLTGSVTLPASVTEVGGAAFFDNQLTSVVLPESSITFGDSVFQQNNISSFAAPSWLTNIPSFFMKNNPLKTLTLAQGVATIGREAFAPNNLTTVNLPASITGLGPDVFSTNRRLDPLKVFFMGAPPSIDQNGLPFSNFRNSQQFAFVNVYAPASDSTWKRTFGYTSANYKVNRFNPSLLGVPAPAPVLSQVVKVKSLNPGGPTESWIFIKIPVRESTTFELKTSPAILFDFEEGCRSDLEVSIPGFAKNKKYIFCEVPVTSKWSKLLITPFRYGIAGTTLSLSKSELTGKKVAAYVCTGPRCKKQ